MLRFVPLVLLLLLFYSSQTSAQVRFFGDITQTTGIQIDEPNAIYPILNTIHGNLEFSRDDIELHWSNRIRQTGHARVDSLEWDIPEIYMTVYLPNGDLTTGRHWLSWGFSDMSPAANRMQARDFRYFLVEPQEAIRLGSFGSSYRHFFSNSTLDAAVILKHQPYHMPAPDSPWFPNIALPALLNAQFQSDDTEYGIQDIQYGLQWQLNYFQDLDIALQALYWHNPIPAYYKTIDENIFTSIPFAITVNFQEYYQQSISAGAGVQYRFGNGWRFATEHIWTHQQPVDVFPENIGVLQQLPVSIPEITDIAESLFEYNSFGFLEVRPVLASTNSLIWQRSNLLLTVQYASDFIFNYDDNIVQDEFYSSISTLVRNSFFRELLEVQLLGVYNLNGNDYWLHPSVTFDLADAVSLSGGMHYFGGDDIPDLYGHLSFRHYQPNNLAYFRFAFYW